MTATADRPAWQVDPRSRLCSPDVRAAYRAGTLHLVVLELRHGQSGYTWATDAATAETHADRLRTKPPIGATGVVTVQPYPYDREVA